MHDPPEPAAGRSLRLCPADAGRRLDVLLADWLGTSRAEARRLLAHGAVQLDGRRLRLRDKGLGLPGVGVVVVDSFTPPGKRRIQPARDVAGSVVEPPAILSHGDGWLAVDKPAGVPVHPLHEDEPDSVIARLVDRYPQIQGIGEGGLRSGVVHRLDVDTSGVLLVATTEPAWQRLRRAFREHRVEKVYRALVVGDLDTGSGSLELDLQVRVAQHRPARVRVIGESEPAPPGARRVQQSVRSLERLRIATLVEVRPRTGHLHQIRASLAHLGHPVLADRSYECEPSRAEIVCGATRQLLHAAHVAFEEVVAESPDPADFVEALSRLRGPGRERGADAAKERSR